VCGRLKGFTLLELLVVLGATSILTAILLPVVVKVRRQAKTLKGMSNQRQIVGVVNLFAVDNNRRYPESVATIGFGNSWNWQEPRMMTAYRRRSPGLHRSMSAHLRKYIKDARVMSCPSSPYRYKYLQQSWEAGDAWDSPETPVIPDPVIGTYCFYWNYTGYLAGRRRVFVGPKYLGGGRGQSKLLVSDYFGYDHWRSPNAYGSCERFTRADIIEETWVSSAYWSRVKLDDRIGLDTLKIRLHAGYADGHVEAYGPSETAPMKVSLAADGSVPYPDGVGAGTLYLPSSGLY
jgi:prepilin-type N-terminal cleavage/methylation domain-containing protein